MQVKNVFKVVEFNKVLNLSILECPECASRVMMSMLQLRGYCRLSNKIGSKLQKILKDLRILS